MSLTVVCSGGQGPDDIPMGLLRRLQESTAVLFAVDSCCRIVDWLKNSSGLSLNWMMDLVIAPNQTDFSHFSRTVLDVAVYSDVYLFVPSLSPIGDRCAFEIILTASTQDIPIQTVSVASTHSGLPYSNFNSLVDLMSRLRDPDFGCPWDKEQTVETLKKYVIEEAYEVVEAIDVGDLSKLAEELGDLLLQVIFQSELASQSNQFTVSDVIRSIVEKLVRRHPHVFGSVVVDGSDEVLTNWEQIKRTEVGYEDRTSILDGIPAGLPALMRALEVSKRVVKVGFEWPSVNEVLDKIDEELVEMRAEIARGDRERTACELGDLLFTLVNVGRQLGVDAEESLRQMTHRFAARFRKIEEHAASRNLTVQDLTLAEMEAAWQAAKLS